MVEGLVTGEQGDEAWFDLIEIFAPDHCTVEFPPASTEPICYADFDLTGDCMVNDQDLIAFSQQWLTSGIESTLGETGDPNNVPEFYRYYKYDWSDGNKALGTFPSADDPNGMPRVANILNPEDPNTSQAGARQLEITCGDYDGASVYLAQVNELQHNDRIFVQIKMKSGGADGADLRLAMDHHRNGAYAGGLFTRPIYSTDEWGTYATIFTYDVGDLTQFDPRTGIKILVLANGNLDDLAGYIDEIIVSVPYHEDQWGNEKSGWVQFPDNGILMNRGKEIFPKEGDLLKVCVSQPTADFGGVYCFVDISDFAGLTSQWLECGWSDSELCP